MNANQARGATSEKMVADALNVIRKRGEEKHKGGLPIKKIVHSEKNSDLDRRGIDFVVSLNTGEDIPLQVKSSESGRKKFERRCKRMSTAITVIVVHFGEDIWKIVHRVIQKIKQTLDATRHAKEARIHLDRLAARRDRKLPYRNYFAPRMCH